MLTSQMVVLQAAISRAAHHPSSSSCHYSRDQAEFVLMLQHTQNISPINPHCTSLL
jgi:hypothetical protein